jgi:diguanylate cyclase (GGDEF)-like protein
VPWADCKVGFQPLIARDSVGFRGRDSASSLDALGSEGPGVFHIETAILVNAILSALVGAMFAYGAGAFPERLRRPVHLWGLAMIGGGVAWLVFGMRAAPTPYTAVLALAHVLLAMSYLGLLRSLRGLFGVPQQPWFDGGLLAAVAFGAIWFTFVSPNLGGRIASLILVISAICVASGVLVWRHAPRPLRPGAEIALTSFAVVGVLLVLRAVGEISGIAPTVDFRAGSLAHGGLFVLGTLGPTASSVGFLMMAHDQVRDELDRLATRDSLTGVLRRRTFEQMAERALAEARRHGRAVGLLLIDADHFKRINDQLGHATGDAALCALADYLAGAIRAEDLLGRYGGEEFVVLMPDVDLLGATTAAERLRAGVAADSVARRAAYTLQVSIGVAASTIDDDFGSLLRRADLALYAAKRGGRNRVAVADPGTEISVIEPSEWRAVVGTNPGRVDRIHPDSPASP